MAWAFPVARKLGLRAAGFCPSAAATFATRIKIPEMISGGVLDERSWPKRRGAFQLAPAMPAIDTSEFSWNRAGDASCAAWLDAQPAGSVVYAAFGSFAAYDAAQLVELAEGFLLTSRPFLWVVRPGSAGEELFEQLRRRAGTWWAGARSRACWRTPPSPASSRTAAGTPRWRPCGTACRYSAGLTSPINS